MKKTILGVICFLLLFSISMKADAAETKNISIYLIAGQSNAAGFTYYDAEVLSKLDQRYVNGFENVYYAGAAAAPEGSNMYLSRVELQAAKAGLGWELGKRIGPELGMAAALSEYHNSNTGTYAGIIKYAVGGTCLLNTLTGQNEAGGNWVPPSYEKTLTQGVTSKTGALYDNFLREVEMQLEAYRNKGFNPVIKGMYWMQGESDTNSDTNEYAKAFQYFAKDIRTDLTKITGQNLMRMPIVVGLISKTFYSAEAGQVAINEKFIAMQKTLPNLVKDCYVIETSEFALNDENNILGSDRYHWNYLDMIEIGKLAANKLRKECLHVFNCEVEAKAYQKSAGTCTKRAVYYKSCDCGAKSPSETFTGSLASHKFGSYTVTREATAKQEGLKRHTCLLCKYTEMVSMPKKEAQYEVNGVLPDVQEPGEDMEEQIQDTSISDNTTGISVTTTKKSTMSTGMLIILVFAGNFAIIFLGSAGLLLYERKKSKKINKSEGGA